MATLYNVPNSTSGTSPYFVPEVWSKECQIQRESKLYMSKRVDRFDADFAGSGDVLHVPKITDLTASLIGTDGSLADQANTEGEVQLVVDKWYGLSLNIPDLLKVQSRYDLMSKYTEKMGYALGKIVETLLLAEYSNATGSAGTAAVDLTDATLRTAVQALDDALAPMEDRHAIVKPSQKNALLGIDKFVRYDSIPFSAANSPIKTGGIGEIYGVEFVVSPLIGTISGATANIMWHKSAFGLALVKDVKVEQFARTQFSDRIGASELFGIKTMRADHGVQLKS